MRCLHTDSSPITSENPSTVAARLSTVTWSFDLQECIKKLDDRFPASPRVDRLKGLALEAQGDADGAHLLYDALLEADPTNVVRPFMTMVYAWDY